MRREVGVRLAGRDQIGLQTNIVENPIGREVCRGGGSGGSRGMDAPEASATWAAKAGSASPSRSRVFQSGWLFGGRNCIASVPEASSRPSNCGAAPGQRRWPLHPACLVAVALDGRLPVGRHPQLCERALDADRAGGEVDPPDIR